MNRLPGLELLRGFRLSKLELYNWGTFDGSVHGFHPRGDWTLLVGENGTGKSTIVDALLTLLVRPGIRKYNFASGAAKTERDERTYIQGAFDKVIGPTGTPQLRYLRTSGKHYSALLACFENPQTAKTFTICQVLYLDSNNKAKKFYAYDDQHERGIAEDLGNITEHSSVLATLKSRDFKATESYAQYFEWLRRKVHCLPKAMDMFNQAAWVKDVNQLDTFVREQMLEKQPWDDKVSRLLKHFAELSEAHRALVNVRDQHKLLVPIAEGAEVFQKAAQKLDKAKRQLEATSLYFDFAISRLLTPMCKEWEEKLLYYDDQLREIDRKIGSVSREIARLEVEIAGTGGERMARLPDLIEQEKERAATKQNERTRLESLLHQCEVEAEVKTAEQLFTLQATVRQIISETTQSRNEFQESVRTLQYEIGELKSNLSDDREELLSLESRKGNMPRELVFLRDEICCELRIPTKDLPFAAELMAVLPEYRDWEGSIELVLNGFARDLLVKEQHYAKVSGYIDHNRLKDREGRGQRLNYTRIVSSSPTQRIEDLPSGKHLSAMLRFREENELAAWVRGQIADRFDFLACNTIEEFQNTRHPAMTRNRHVKRGQLQHSKDDRGRAGDRKQFVLGWENREKILALKALIDKAEQQLLQLEVRDKSLNDKIESATRRLGNLEQVASFTDFSSIDNESHQQKASEYQLELENLKNSNDRIRELEGQKQECEEQVQSARSRQSDLLKQKTNTEHELKSGQQLCEHSDRQIEDTRRNGTWDVCSLQFESIEALLSEEPLSIQNISTLPKRFKEDRYKAVDRLGEQVESIAGPLRKKMARFLHDFAEYRTDMDAEVESLPEFVVLHTRIEEEDLPRHEKRFKQRLNEKVLHEVGVLNSHLENEREEITSKIEEINEGLRRMEWNPGTHIRLEPEDCKDPEIRDFRRELTGCLTGYLAGETQASEETFLRIQKLVDNLRDDKNIRWREKVIDVRRWFNFSAREINNETGASGSYYDGGSGKSGGEKARLAFLVLVAAIVYQYDIDPDDPRSDKFHFVMVDEMFSRTASKYAKQALDLFQQFGLQLLIVAPLDAKARVCEPYVKLHAHVVKDANTNRSEILSYASEHVHDFTNGNPSKDKSALS